MGTPQGRGILPVLILNCLRSKISPHSYSRGEFFPTSEDPHGAILAEILVCGENYHVYHYPFLKITKQDSFMQNEKLLRLFLFTKMIMIQCGYPFLKIAKQGNNTLLLPIFAKHKIAAISFNVRMVTKVSLYSVFIYVHCLLF